MLNSPDITISPTERLHIYGPCCMPGISFVHRGHRHKTFYIPKYPYVRQRWLWTMLLGCSASPDHTRARPLYHLARTWPIFPRCRMYAWVNQVSIGSDNGLSPGGRQAIIWTNTGLLPIGPLGTNFSEILIKLQNFSYTKMHLNTPSAKWRPFFQEEMSLLLGTSGSSRGVCQGMEFSIRNHFLILQTKDLQALHTLRNILHLIIKL